MPKRLIRRYLPAPERIIHHPALRFMSKRLADPGLWHLHRRSAAGAMFWGLWCAMMPMPGQMLLAATLAIFFRVNLPLTIVLTWVSNPLTAIPLIWVAYWLGSLFLGVPMLSGAELRHVLNDLTIVVGGWFGGAQAAPTNLGKYVEPFLLGAMTLGFLSGVLGYVLMRAYWRWHVVTAWQKRQARRQQAGSAG
ncbi:MAG: DUF2062 domain-containing protein [Pseudomonadota bacterium]